MPGDPQIDEAGCIFMLQQEINLQTMPYHQNAALQVVADLYDRKATREEFMKSVGTAISFYSTISKLFVLEQVKDLLAKDSLNDEIIGLSEGKLLEIAVKKNAGLVQIMERLQQCPWSEDKVH